MLKISIIVAVYQIEKYVSECIESVISQSYQNIELILVDDGSADHSPEICDMYAEKDDRIIVIHKPNGGLSDARNAGIQIAAGDYILFLDGDDFFIDKDAVQKLVSRIEITDADVLNYSYVKYYEDTNERINYFDNVPVMPDNSKTYSIQLDYLTKNHLYIASACNKIIRKELFDQDLMFRKDVYSEDVEWCLKLMNKAKSMDFECLNFYSYRQRRDSIHNTINDKKLNDLCDNIQRCFSICEVMNDSVKEYAYRYIAYQYGTFYINQAISEDDPAECVDRMKPYTQILKYHCGHRKLIILDLITRVLGFRNACKLIRCGYQIREKRGLVW